MVPAEGPQTETGAPAAGANNSTRREHQQRRQQHGLYLFIFFGNFLCSTGNCVCVCVCVCMSVCLCCSEEDSCKDCESKIEKQIYSLLCQKLTSSECEMETRKKKKAGADLMSDVSVQIPQILFLYLYI
ncbi:hypothetical protein INR49_000058 [Caranx melampygus]|nr:hypothetical protein INR49_000058 [Caranx melampygus]